MKHLESSLKICSTCFQLLDIELAHIIKQVALLSRFLRNSIL